MYERDGRARGREAGRYKGRNGESGGGGGGDATVADDVPRLALGGKALSIDKTHVRAESARHDLCQATRQIVAAPVLPKIESPISLNLVFQL